MNRQEHLLACLGEECAEVGQAVGKALRFGLSDSPPGGGLPNNEYIVREINDIFAIIELLHDSGIIFEGIGSRPAIDAKKEKVKIFMTYAEQRGTLAPAEQRKQD